MAVSAGLTVSATINRAVSYSRAIQANLTAVVTVVRTLGTRISTSTNLTVSTLITRYRNYDITTTANLTVSVLITCCYTLKELLRTTAGRLDIHRLSPSKIPLFRRIRRCL